MVSSRNSCRNDIQDAVRDAVSKPENIIDNRSITVRYRRSLLSSRCHTFNVVISGEVYTRFSPINEHFIDEAVYINRLRDSIEEIISRVEIAVGGTHCFDEPIKVPRKAIRTMSPLGQGVAVLHSTLMIQILSLLCHLVLAVVFIS